MDTNTTFDGSQPSGLDCSTLQSGSCVAPSNVQCQNFTPPAYYFIRWIASGVLEHMRKAKDQLTRQVIINGLSVGAISTDFPVPVTTEDSLKDVLTIISPILGEFGTVAGGGVGTAVSLLSSGVSVVNNGITPPQILDTADFKDKTEEFLGQVFDRTQTFFDDLLKDIFGKGLQMSAWLPLLQLQVKRGARGNCPSDGVSFLRNPIGYG
jgi:hypothetical protein